MVRQSGRSPPVETPTLSWPSRGASVVRDTRTGRWRFGTRTEASLSRRELARHGNPDRSPSLLLVGEAHDALRALAKTHSRRFRLCYIDPPFNTGQDFEIYDDRASHAVWLSGLEERLAAAQALLLPGGFVVAHVNVVEQAYLKVLMDERFGRDQLVGQIVWQRTPDRTLLGQGNSLLSDQVEYLLVYRVAGRITPWPKPTRRVPFADKTLRTYGRSLTFSNEAQLVGEFRDGRGEPVRILAHHSHRLERVSNAISSDRFSTRVRLTNQQPESTFQQRLLGHMPKKGVLYRAEFVQPRGKHQGDRSRYYLNGQVVLWLRDVAIEEQGALVRVTDLNNFWTADEIPVTGIAHEGQVTLRRGKKPERLLERLIGAFSQPGEWVLDFFAGSGTTAAVAARMGRKFVTVEAGKQARELCEPRLRRQVEETGGGFVVEEIVGSA